ncbi:MAG: hypothetical protein WA700_18155 [Acidobacteriaceae bacterium]
MQPHQLNPESFSRYPAQGKAFAVKHLVILRQIPLALLPILLRVVIEYDWCFPVEQRMLDHQFDYLETLEPSSFASLMAPFAALRLPSEASKIDWVNNPQRFSEQLSALLWSTQQIDEYRKAASQYQERLEQVLAGEPPVMPRFTIVCIGQGVSQSNAPLFRMLRPHGALFTNVEPGGGMETLIEFINERAQKYPEKYAHWYIDGGHAEPACGAQQGVTVTSYNELAPVALKELSLVDNFIERTGETSSTGPEAAQSFMASLGPKDLGLHGSADDAVLRHFEVKLLTEGAGTQVFSTTFVQWAAREAMRRAQPITMLARFAPRQRMAPMNELLKRNPLTQPTDPEGSLVDADMGAYYTWINQGRLAGGDQARFLAWFESHGLAIAIAPSLPGGTTSDAPSSMKKILEWMN